MTARPISPPRRRSSSGLSDHLRQFSGCFVLEHCPLLGGLAISIARPNYSRLRPVFGHERAATAVRGVPMPLHGPIFPVFAPLCGGVLQPSPYSILAEEPLAVGSVNAVLGRHRERRFGLNRRTPRPDAGDPRGATGPARRAASHCVRRDRTSGIRSRVSGAVGGQLSSLNTDQFGCLSLRRSIRRKSNQRLRCSHI